ncbi:MAG: glycosyl hydrolase [Verrucomicrobiota bacterium]
MIHQFGSIFLFCAVGVATALAQPTLIDGSDAGAKTMKWTPVIKMSDEFEGASLDKSKWQDEPIGNGWNWDGRAPGLFRAENIRVDDGKLKVTVSTLPEPIKQGRKTFLYQGAIVRSHHAGQPGWFFECRMKANATEMSSTFWLMTKGRTIRKLELDIQECVGRVSPQADSWAEDWDQIFHSNLIHRVNEHNRTKVQLEKSVPTPTKNHERYYVYGAWWKSTEEVLFFLDGKHVYTIKPKVEWDVPAFIQMAIETYDWNPVPEDGGLVASGTKDQRTTSYDWVRVWKPAPQKVK